MRESHIRSQFSAEKLELCLQPTIKVLPSRRTLSDLLRTRGLLLVVLTPPLAQLLIAPASLFS